MALLKHCAYKNQTPCRLYMLSDYFKVLESMRFFKLPHSCLMLYLFIFLSFYLFISNVFSSSYHTDNGQFTAMNFATTEPPLTVLDNSASINASKTFISP
jgi:hypothetical protein